jgi:uncharacterized protein (UPF0248 family)
LIPIEDLLHRIQWDPGYAGAAIEVGYLDRVGRRIARVPFERIRLVRGHHFSFEAMEDDGTLHQVPFHRVREVWCNGRLIWERAAEAR